MFDCRRNILRAESCIDNVHGTRRTDILKKKKKRRSFGAYCNQLHASDNCLLLLFQLTNSQARRASLCKLPFPLLFICFYVSGDFHLKECHRWLKTTTAGFHAFRYNAEQSLIKLLDFHEESREVMFFFSKYLA